VHRRTFDLWQSADYRWRELFEAADVMSEGATRSEPSGLVYYGSSSVLLPVMSAGGLLPDAELGDLLRLISHDPHARVRAIRIACLEAQLRSGGALGSVRAELVVRRDPRGIRIDVDVEAAVRPSDASGHESAPEPGARTPGAGRR